MNGPACAIFTMPHLEVTPINKQLLTERCPCHMFVSALLVFGLDSNNVRNSDSR